MSLAKRRTEGQQSLSVDLKAVPAAVEIIGSSGIFDDDRRSLELLRYLVAEELSGRGQQVSAEHVGAEVLGKEKRLNPISESEVRLAILQLRNALEQYYEGHGKNEPLKISLKPATLRLEISEQKIAAPMQSTRGLARTNRRSLTLRQLVVALAVMLTVSAIVAAAILYLPERLQNRADQCASARPFVAISFIDTPGFNPDKLKAWELTLRRYIDYYPRVTQEPGNAASCPGTPSYMLEIGNPADPAASVVASLTTLDGEFIWSKSYRKEEFAESDGEYVGLAKIAYEIGFGRGVVALDAANRPWQNEVAFDQYKCITQTHEYFYKEVESRFDAAFQCLKQYTKQTKAPADAYGLYAALLLNGVLHDQPNGKQQIINEINQLIENGSSKESTNSELLMVELRMARNGVFDVTKGYASTAKVAAIVDRYFHMEPHLLNQLALSYAMQGGFEQALGYSARAKAIMGDTASIYIAPTIAHIGLGEWDLAASAKRKLSAERYSYGPLMLLAIAHKTDDQKNIAFALDQLQKLNFTTQQQILAEVDRLPYGDRFKEQLTNSITELFDKQQAR